MDVMDGSHQITTAMGPMGPRFRLTTALLVVRQMTCPSAPKVARRRAEKHGENDGHLFAWKIYPLVMTNIAMENGP
jgi:hypothetical protein